MKLVHLSDLHLGFRQHENKLTKTGVNQREADVAATFNVAIDRVIGLAPDVIVIPGDVFHWPRPTNTTILTAQSGFVRLTQALPRAVVVMVAGNHDTPRIGQAAGLLQMFAPFGIHVVDRTAERLYFPEHDLSILAVPDVPGLVRPALEPDPGARRNVLVLHGEVQGMLPEWAAGGERAVLEITEEELRVPQWDYVALGHYHVYRELAPNMFYSGSIDYTSSNPWGELVEEREAGLPGKGFAERDLDTGAQTFHALPVSRALIDVPRIDAHGMTGAQLVDAIGAGLAAASDIAGKLVRVVVDNVSRELSHELDPRALRDFRRGPFNLSLDFRRPEAAQHDATAAVFSAMAGRRRKSLDEMLLDRFNAIAAADPALGADFIALGMSYLTRVTEPDENDLTSLLEQSLDAPATPSLESKVA